MTAVQAEMRRLKSNNATAEDIAIHFFDNFGVIAQQHLEGRLWLFDYDQLAAHKHRTTDIVMESRGLVLCAETLDIVRRPFSRFFNIGEAPAYEADIDYARLEAFEKADGSLTTLYFNKVSGHWHFGTRGTPFAEGKHRLGGKFYDRVARAAGLSCLPGSTEFDELVGALLEREVTYLFEFIGPENPHITPHEQSELVLLGARHHSGAEFTPAEVHALAELLKNAQWNVRLPRVYPIPLDLAGMSKTQQLVAIKEWVAFAPAFKGLHEGVVCRDPVTGKRLKVKTPLYCAAHLQGSSEGTNLSLSRIIELVVTGDADEFCIYIPHLAPLVRKAQEQVDAYLAKLEPLWDNVQGIEDQKAFSLAVQEHVPASASGIFFQARKSNSRPMSVWNSMPLSKKTNLAEKLVAV